MGGEGEDEDERREAALAATPVLRPDFKPSKITQAQLDKLKELQKRRLQLKEISKNIAKSKDAREKNLTKKSLKEINELVDPEELSLSNAKGNINMNEGMPTTSKKRQKLHWGLDAKERWERKANM